MKKFVIGKIINIIKNYYNYNDIKIAEIKYGLEILYLTITKAIIILLLTYLLGTLKELLFILLFYGLLRMSGFGLHAKKSWQCWIGSLIFFIGFSYLSSIIIISMFFKIIISILSIIIFIMFAPADTEKRPLINKKKKIFLKIMCVITALIYSITIFKINNNIIINTMVFSLIIESIMILPISYRIFKLKYNNYKNYRKQYT